MLTGYTITTKKKKEEKKEEKKEKEKSVMEKIKKVYDDVIFSHVGWKGFGTS